MKPSKLENPELQSTVIQGLVMKKPKSEIAKDVGVSRSAVSRFSNRQDVQNLVREQTLRILEILPDAVSNIRKLVRQMRHLKIDNHKARELCFKATSRVLESGGIFNAPAPQIVNVFGGGQVMPEIIKALLEQVTIRDLGCRSLLEPTVVDGEIIDNRER